MSTEREVLKNKLARFYERHDPARLNAGFEAIVDYGLVEGYGALNAGLMEQYGDYLDSGSDMAISQGDRQIVRSKIEMFYLKMDPAKLDNPGDVEAIVDWALFNGLDQLSEKLARKYDEYVEEVEESDVLVQLEVFYAKHDKSKTQEQVRTVLTWGIVHGFTVLNRKLIDKYGEGLGSTDRKKLTKDLEEKLTAFYNINDKSKLALDNLEFIVQYALKNGLNSLNTRLQAKYMCNLNTIARAKPPLPSSSSSARKSLGEKLRSSFRGGRTSSVNSTQEEALAAVRADEEYREYLRKLIEIFYAKHDPNRLLEEGVSAVVDFAVKAGEEALNVKLKKKYGEDLLSMDDRFQAIRERLVAFYTKYEPAKLENDRDIDTVVGWALVHGVDKLNESLRKKYDEDIDASALKKRLLLFYQAQGESKSEKDLDRLARFVFENSIEELNKKLKKKYGKSLGDTSFADEPPPPPDEDDPPPPPTPVTSNKSNGARPLPGKAAKSPSKTPPTPSKTSKNSTPAPLPNESQKEQPSEALEKKLKRFYEKKNPKLANTKQIQTDIDFILENGVDKFNSNLVDKYGESLVSLRPRTMTKKIVPIIPEGGDENI